MGENMGEWGVPDHPPYKHYLRGRSKNGVSLVKIYSDIVSEHMMLCTFVAAGAWSYSGVLGFAYLFETLHFKVC